MVTATVLSPSQALKRVRAGAAGGLIYLGDEFCEHKQPSFGDFYAVRKAARRAPVLATSILTESGLERCSALLAEAAAKAPGAEIVVNDIGLLRLIRAKYRGRFSVTLGRLLAYSTAIGHTPPSFVAGFLKRYGVRRVEVDSEYVLGKYALHGGLRLSFHYPLRLMAVTRLCPFRGGIVRSCPAPCGGKLLKLTSPRLASPLLAKGNAYFAANRPVKHPMVDREVRTPCARARWGGEIENELTRPARP